MTIGQASICSAICQKTVNYYTYCVWTIIFSQLVLHVHSILFLLHLFPNRRVSLSLGLFLIKTGKNLISMKVELQAPRYIQTGPHNFWFMPFSLLGVPFLAVRTLKNIYEVAYSGIIFSRVFCLYVAPWVRFLTAFHSFFLLCTISRFLPTIFPDPENRNISIVLWGKSWIWFQHLWGPCARLIVDFFWSYQF